MINEKNNITIIINYGLGNLASVYNMIQKVGGNCKISSGMKDIENASRLILPGVGSFDHGIKQLKSFDLFDVIQTVVKAGTPILGICLGMQLLTKNSEEGKLEGLSFVDVECKRFSFKNDTELRVPHVGWNTIQIEKENKIIPKNETEHRFYFTHSYFAICNNKEDKLAITNYGIDFTAAFSHNNIYGVQFHPEKSHRFGMDLFKRFIEL